MSHTDDLRAASAWDDAVEHAFVTELAAETLDDAVFRDYLERDYAFVETLAGHLGHAVADAPDMARKRRFADFLATVVGPEDDYFARSFDALPGPALADARVEGGDVGDAFADLFAHAASVGGYAETLAVLVPVEWVYLEWASGIESDPKAFYHREWIELHDNEAFRALVAWLREELDRELDDASDRERERVERFFARAVDLEVAFFDAAMAGGKR
ncbi:TenA family protein [Halarchaeum nitratireducens]|uniref:Aminopyrimidine aminohydrolase n=1 Tax=Halarchaeum nitratireducens TaxID=489913 RepID=A0A830G8W5_9EURY|nr:TenA family protein [Halarchaeum nitratireducens]MBP2249872.1 thiaminase/transcriptional activator TenA [Halarchaeum solikamskense]GGN10054.1 aminopyrimidine aminohydrolase [Halarchaeum nitratireducens]